MVEFESYLQLAPPVLCPLVPKPAVISIAT